MLCMPMSTLSDCSHDANVQVPAETTGFGLETWTNHMRIQESSHQAPHQQHRGPYPCVYCNVSELPDFAAACA